MYMKQGTKVEAALCLLILLLATLLSKPVQAADGNGFISPTWNATIQGVVTVTGVANHAAFQKWQIDLLVNGDENQALFVALGEKIQPTPAIFTQLDTTRYANGYYVLRLRVVRHDANYDEYFRSLTILNPHSLLPPLGQGVPEGRHWIEVALTTQTLTAWQGNVPVFVTQVSTGKPGYSTITGMFYIYAKFAQTRMVGADYDTPDVPWTLYFSGDFGIHGAYWHNSFGAPVSHGCVNMRVAEAKALFAWADVGTAVVVHE